MALTLMPMPSQTIKCVDRKTGEILLITPFVYSKDNKLRLSFDGDYTITRMAADKILSFNIPEKNK